MNSASSTCSRAESTRRRAATGRRAALDAADVVGRALAHCSTGRGPLSSAHRSRTPIHSPSVQYFRLCRDSRARAAPRSRSRTAGSRRLEPLHRPQVHVRRIVVGGLRPAGARHLLLQRRVRIELEQVDRRVLRARRRPARRATRRGAASVCPGSQSIRSRLTLSKPARRASPTAAAGPCGVVHPPEPAELGVPEGLDTETETVDAGGADTRRSRRLVDRLRVRLQRDLGRRIDVEGRAAGVDDGARSPAGSSSDGVPPPK